MEKIDEQYMQRTLVLAEKARGRTNPNPMVGAVIVKENQIVGEGYHDKAGTPHAEIHALRDAGEEARGATVYVSLEPCSHFGKTPPCADAIIAAGVRRVVIAMMDPNPKVAGQGIDRLQKADIEVCVGVLEEKANRLNEVFLKHIQTGMPFVALKSAMSMDGKIACESGDSKWITNEESRLYVHTLRNSYDGILAGIGTVLKDDPMLNTRLEGNDVRDPIRIIIDTFLDIPEESQIVKTAEQQRTIVFCGNEADDNKQQNLAKKGIQIIRLSAHNNKVSLEEVLKTLYQLGVCSVLIEGGGEINGDLVRHRLIDKFYLFIGAKIIGGRNSPGPVGGVGIQQMSAAMPMKITDINRYGEDVLLVSYPEEY
ncbi:MAG: bifunctional diaminohydroxyphosphoribosylaminopyrimidine deaminase/5-amino-6-(5-phosphoribosylamino)uracil reductase RibD [Bacillota bacterium]|nr:bifunctional diaminohydroxyphosphoribosylaminopyrimidine deaminase/5-amino-6-(5-phosphoribosylamino)uracil reductase RibD [Bacillota bacterium]